jgi:hypothetical protein
MRLLELSNRFISNSFIIKIQTNNALFGKIPDNPHFNIDNKAFQLLSSQEQSLILFRSLPPYSQNLISYQSRLLSRVSWWFFCYWQNSNLLLQRVEYLIYQSDILIELNNSTSIQNSITFSLVFTKDFLPIDLFVLLFNHSIISNNSIILNSFTNILC